MFNLKFTPIYTWYLKTIICYTLLLTIIIKPLYNISCISYYELNIDYIIETYCVNKEKPKLQCNGKCHLANQLASLDIENSKDSSYINLLTETFIPVYFKAYSYNFNLVTIEEVLKNSWKYNKKIISRDQESLDRPPQFS